MCCRLAGRKENVPEVHNVVELCDSTVPDFRASETPLSLNLGREVSEENDGGLIRSKKERSNEQVGGRERRRITAGGLHVRDTGRSMGCELGEDVLGVFSVELDDDEIDAIRQVHV